MNNLQNLEGINLREAAQATRINQGKKPEETTEEKVRLVQMEMEEKVRLVQMEMEERAQGTGVMKRLKARWSNEAETKRTLSTQNLADNVQARSGSAAQIRTTLLYSNARSCRQVGIPNQLIARIRNALSST